MKTVKEIVLEASLMDMHRKIIDAFEPMKDMSIDDIAKKLKIKTTDAKFSRAWKDLVIGGQLTRLSNGKMRLKQ